MNITQEQVDAASKQENALINEAHEVLVGQVNYLQNRVVMLRAALDATTAELESARQASATPTETGEGINLPDPPAPLHVITDLGDGTA